MSEVECAEDQARLSFAFVFTMSSIAGSEESYEYESEEEEEKNVKVAPWMGEGWRKGCLDWKNLADFAGNCLQTSHATVFEAKAEAAARTQAWPKGLFWFDIIT